MPALDKWGSVVARGRDPNRVITYTIPTEILFGSGVVSELGNRLTSLEIRKPLIVTDRGVRGGGIVDSVLTVLSSADIQASVYDDVQSDPSTSIVEAVRDLVITGGHDSIIGIGGGSSMDVAKAAGALATNPGKAQMYVGLEKLSADPIPTVAIPTTAGTGSEVTKWAVLTDAETGRKASIGSMRIMPKLAVLDPELTTGLPPSITAMTGMDALTHAVESYGSVWNHPIAEALALKAVELIGRYLRKAVQNGSDIEARSNMLMASMIAELAANSTRLGLCHALALPLGAQYHIPHGLANAILLPYVVSFNSTASPERYCHIASLLDSKGIEPREAMRSLNADIGITQRLSEWGIGEAGIPDLVADAVKSDNVQANPRMAGEAELAAILRAAL